MTYECFELAIEHKIAHLRLSRPKAFNSMLPSFWTELPQIVHELSDRGDVRALVISSTGKHFSSGMDLSVFTGPALQRSGEPGRAAMTLQRLIRQLQDSFTSLEHARMPVLVAIQGGCIGGAVDMVCAADMRYATRDAFFQVQETNIGMTADVGSLQRLPKLVPDGVARELVFTGRRMTAQRAFDVGLVNGLFDDHEALVTGVMAVAHEIASKSPLAIWGAKESIVHSRDHGVDEGLSRIAAWQAGAFHSGDIEESLRAQQEQRPPHYEDLPPQPTL